MISDDNDSAIDNILNGRNKGGDGSKGGGSNA